MILENSHKLYDSAFNCAVVTQGYCACHLRHLVTPNDMCCTFAMHFLLQASSNKRHACTRCKTIGDFLNRLLLLQTRKKHLMSSLCFPAKYRRLVRAASLFKLWSGLQHTSGKLPYDVPKWDIVILDSIDVVADQCPWKRKLAWTFKLCWFKEWGQGSITSRIGLRSDCMTS